MRGVGGEGMIETISRIKALSIVFKEYYFDTLYRPGGNSFRQITHAETRSMEIVRIEQRRWRRLRFLQSAQSVR